MNKMQGVFKYESFIFAACKPRQEKWLYQKSSLYKLHIKRVIATSLELLLKENRIMYYH